MERKYDVVAFGELLIDFTPAGISEGGMRLFEQNPGGAPVNMLTAVTKNGYQTAFIGKVGNDMHGMFLRDTAQKIGIDVCGLILSEDVFTTLAFVGLSKQGERTFSFARKPGADTRICYREIPENILQNTKILHIGSLSLTDEPARTTTFQAVHAAKAAGAVISYDPNYRAPLWKSEEEATERMRTMIQYVDIMKISDEETGLLTPFQEPREAAEYLLNKGIKIVAVTLGKEGALVGSKKGIAVVSGFSSRVTDTTGAGDAFWGGFVSKYLSFEEKPEDLTLEQLQDCALYGNATASLCVEKRGGIPSIPEQTAVEKRLKMMEQVL